MPPPKPTTEGRRDRQVFRGMGQIVRAVGTEGPILRTACATLVGATWWEEGALRPGPGARGRRRNLCTGLAGRLARDVVTRDGVR